MYAILSHFFAVIHDVFVFLYFRLQRIRLSPEQDRQTDGVLVQLAGLPDVRGINGKNIKSSAAYYNIYNSQPIVIKLT